MFSKNTRESVKSALMADLEVSSEARNDRYLGLPISMGRSKVLTFNYLKERVWKKIQGWKEKLLSKAGKDVLIKAVAQAIPSYAMSCFDLTKTLYDDIGSMICRFWWSQQDKENKMHWLSWELMCSRKEKGGLGYRDLHLFNLAMLARQGWRLLMDPTSLCAQVLQAKYYPSGDPLMAIEKPGISYSWRSILRGFGALKEGLIWRVGDGARINIWCDPWLPYGTTRRPITPKGRCLLNKVSELLDPYTGNWDEELVREIFWEEDVQHILSVPVKQGYSDSLAWHNDVKGLFSVKSAYHVLEDGRERKNVRQAGSTSSENSAVRGYYWNRLWKIDCMPKVKQFLWRLAHNSLPLRMNISRRGMKIDTRCPICWRQDEDGGHCFLKCKWVKICWQQLGLEDVRLHLLTLSSAKEVVGHILQMNQTKQQLTISLLWVWWLSRNKANVGERMLSVNEVVSRTSVSAVEIYKDSQDHVNTRGTGGGRHQLMS